MYSAWLIVGTQHTVITESKYKRKEGKKGGREGGWRKEGSYQETIWKKIRREKSLVKQCVKGVKRKEEVVQDPKLAWRRSGTSDNHCLIRLFSILIFYYFGNIRMPGLKHYYMSISLSKRSEVFSEPLFQTLGGPVKPLCPWMRGFCCPGLLPGSWLLTLILSNHTVAGSFLFSSPI